MPPQVDFALRASGHDNGGGILQSVGSLGAGGHGAVEEVVNTMTGEHFALKRTLEVSGYAKSETLIEPDLHLPRAGQSYSRLHGIAAIGAPFWPRRRRMPPFCPLQHSFLTLGTITSYCTDTVSHCRQAPRLER